MKNLTILAAAIITTILSSCSTAPDSPEKAEKALVKHYENKKVLNTQHGIASWYSVRTNRGTKTASGRKLEDNAYTTAHKTLPLGSKVRVTNMSNGRSEILTVTDRGPFKKGRIVDVTIGSSKRLGFYSRGLAKVKVELLERGDWNYKRIY